MAACGSETRCHLVAAAVAQNRQENIEAAQQQKEIKINAPEQPPRAQGTTGFFAMFVSPLGLLLLLLLLFRLLSGRCGPVFVIG